MSLVQRMSLRWKKPVANDLVKLKAGQEDSEGHFCGAAGCVVRDNGSAFELEVLGNPPMHRVFVPHSHVELFVPEPSSFPLMQLPMPCLSRVVGLMGSLQEALLLARVCKRFLSAFRDQIAWRLRAEKEGLVRPDDVPAETNWFATYQDRTEWRVTVVPTESQIYAGDDLWQCDWPMLKLYVRPTALLDEFLALLSKEAKEKYPTATPCTAEGMHKRLHAFEPARFGRSRGVPRRWFPKYPKANCPDFAVPENLEARAAMTVREAGLCQGATLMFFVIVH